MDDTFFDGHAELYHHAKFGEDRTMRAGCRCENVVFVFVCLFVCHAPSPEHRAFDGCIVRTRSSADADNRLDAFTITGAPVNTTVTYN